MKTFCKHLIFATLFFFSIIPVFGQNYKAGDKIEAYDLEERNWFPAEVLKSEQSKWLIHYVGYASDFDIWLESDRLRTTGSKTTYKPYEYKVGERVEGTSDKGLTWTYKAKILKKENNRWLLHYDGTASSDDIIQSEVNMHPCPKCPAEEVKTIETTTSGVGKYPGDGIYQKYDLVELYDEGVKNWALAVLTDYNESSKVWSVQGLGLMWSLVRVNESEKATKLRKPIAQPKVIAGRSNKDVMKQMTADLAPHKDGIDAFENSYNYSFGSNGTGTKAMGFGSIYDQNLDLEKAKKQISDMEAAVKIVKEKYNNQPNEYAHYWTENPQVILFLWENKDECIKRCIVGRMSYDMTILYKLNTLDNINFKEEKDANYGFYEYFAKVNGFNDLIASFNDREEMKYYAALDAKNPYNWTEVEKTYRIKEKEYMAYVTEYSKTLDIFTEFHNPTLETLAKKEFSKYYPKAVILKSWLNKNDYTIRKNALGIPEYKFNLVYVLCTSPDYKTQFYTYIDVTCNYAGSGTYSAPFAAFDKIMWAQRTGFILNKN